jgi:hypothetical protein
MHEIKIFFLSAARRTAKCIIRNIAPNIDELARNIERFSKSTAFKIMNYMLFSCSDWDLGSFLKGRSGPILYRFDIYFYSRCSQADTASSSRENSQLMCRKVGPRAPVFLIAELKIGFAINHQPVCIKLIL